MIEIKQKNLYTQTSLIKNGTDNTIENCTEYIAGKKTISIKVISKFRYSGILDIQSLKAVKRHRTITPREIK